MKLTLQIFSWIAVVIGVLAVLGSFGITEDGTFGIVDYYGILGGGLFFAQGALSLIYIHKD